MKERKTVQKKDEVKRERNQRKIYYTRKGWKYGVGKRRKYGVPKNLQPAVLYSIPPHSLNIPICMRG
jgi:hypothetical protein